MAPRLQWYWCWNTLKFYLSALGNEIPQEPKICAEWAGFIPDHSNFGNTVI